MLMVGASLSVWGAEPAAPTLRGVFADDFLVGVALSGRRVNGRDAEAAGIAARQFSSLTAENDMKWMALQPWPGRYRFEAADAYVAFAEKHGMKVIGHTLVWHSQTPRWVFEGQDGKSLDREELLKRMKAHIDAVVGRYKGRVHGWDVVNEAISDGPGGLRDSPWRRIIGDDFIEQAFRFARAADPKSELYYNDYGLVDRRKRARTIVMLKRLIAHGVPIDAVGMQGHYSLDRPSASEVERAIQDFAALGLKVMITELDVDVLPSRGRGGVADISRRETAHPRLDPYRDGLPDDVQQRLGARYAELFRVFLRHREHVTRVTFWGLDDGHTWLNHFPIRGRTNHPVLFDRELHPKPAFFSVIKAGQEDQPSR
jgi:endo-1,4-beta-xylanase